jgi:hypothetical protein
MRCEGACGSLVELFDEVDDLPKRQRKLHRHPDMSVKCEKDAS